jgi:uncharacterized protein with HEPN domain
MSRDRPNVLAMLEAIDRIEQYTRPITDAQGFQANSQAFDATLMNFVVIGEMVDRLSGVVKGRHPEMDWQEIKEFRNIVAHDYLGVDAEEVWQIVRKDLPPLKACLSAILQELVD